MNKRPPVWLKSLHPDRPHRLELFVFPYAGGGVVTFHAWHKHLPPWIRMQLVQLAGRESRFLEAPVQAAVEIVEPVAQAIAAISESPFVIFGHSMGSILAFEVARQLRRMSRLTPAALIVSGRCAPQLRPKIPPVSHLDGAPLVYRASELFGGIPREVLEHQELIELMARVLKADMRIVEEYRYLPEEPLSCPIAAYGGDRDPWVSQSELDAWREQTRGGFIREQFPGDHFYLREEENELRLLGKIREIASRVVAKRDILG